VLYLVYFDTSLESDIVEEASARGSKCCLKNQNYVIRKNWKKLPLNENQWVKDSERKTMSESEVNERETFTHW
jgi:hypothetical protein